MKKTYILLLLILTALLSSCDGLEQTVDSDLPYVEKLIIQGQFGINSRNISVSITKSIPPLEEPTLSKVTITDAVCKVYYKDKVINLIHQGESIYVSEDTLTIEEGVEYRLEVKWKDKVAIATTTIPILPKIISVKEKIFREWGYDQKTYEFTIRSNDKGMIKISENDSYYRDYGFQLIDKIDKEYRVLLSEPIYDEDPANISFEMRFTDIQFYPYYQTRHEGNSDGGIFSNGGLNMEGNVKGDNVFGIWFGYNTFGGRIDDYLDIFKK
ncbi:MAG: DUF4249 family protein [Candidatus Kapaibacterium sp.]|jgi:hypothetical protein